MSALEFHLSEVADDSGGTTADFAVKIDGQPVWPVLGEPDGTLSVCLDDLLSYLVEFWKPLLLRQTYPISAVPDRPSHLLLEAKKRWANLPESLIEHESERVEAFEQAHNLARAFSGLFQLPPLWLLRQGPLMLIDAGEQMWRVPYLEAVSALTQLGDTLAARLDQANSTFARITLAWRDRAQSDELGLLAWSTGLSRDKAADLLADGTLKAPESLDEASNDNDELRIAARMAGVLPLPEMRAVLQRAQEFEHRPSPKLKDLSSTVLELLGPDEGREQPYRRGERAAIFVRDALEVGTDGFVDVFGIISDLGIELRSGPVEALNFEGLAIWGSRHGPGVFLNTISARARPTVKIERSYPARVTLAHEFCHLLLDGAHALSAVDVLGGRMPHAIEQVAKSFAGELLLPALTAGRLWQDAGSPIVAEHVELLLNGLSRRFGVTRSVAAWKLEHGTAALDANLHYVLGRLAPGR